MKISELKRIAEENDYEFEKLKDYEEIVLIRKVSVDGFLANFITISLNFENQIFVKIIHCDERDFNMLKAAVEFAETPPEDREKDKENRPNWMTRWLGEPVRDCEVEVEE